MAVMDEFREEREALKNADFKTKWRYFLDYYKWHAIVTVLVIVAVISYIYGVVTAKDSALFGYFLNTYENSETSEEFNNSLAEGLNIDLDQYTVTIDSTLQISTSEMTETTISSAEKLMVTIAAKEVDFVAANQETFLQYATTDTFFDLREIFTEEELEKYQDYIYYVDMDVVREKEEIVDSGSVETYVAKEYDHFAPEEMGDPVPMALCIQDSPKLDGYYYFTDKIVPLGIVVNTQRLDTTLAFIDYLFEGLVE